MWLVTPIGFFSVVRKPWDADADTLTVRARVRDDLVALREQVLPELGKIAEDPNEVAARQSVKRADL